MERQRLLDSVRDGVLRPLGPGGDRRYQLSTFDHRAGRPTVRDRALFGGDQQVVERYTMRYLPAQALYRERDRPLECADLVVDHTDPAEPRVITDRRPTP